MRQEILELCKQSYEQGVEDTKASIMEAAQKVLAKRLLEGMQKAAANERAKYTKKLDKLTDENTLLLKRIEELENNLPRLSFKWDQNQWIFNNHLIGFGKWELNLAPNGGYVIMPIINE